MLEHGLLDEYRIWFHPLLRGEGRRLFSDGLRARLDLLDVQELGSGVVLHSCSVADRS